MFIYWFCRSCLTSKNDRNNTAIS